MKILNCTVFFAAVLMASSAVAQDSDLIARGQYLVTGPSGCGNCHSPLGPEGHIAGQELSGRLVEDNDAFTAIAPNITPAGRIADWTDAELGRAIREGIRPDGSLIGPPMPFTFYRNLSDTDVSAIVAYLRTVPSVENELGQSVYNIPLPPAYGPPVQTVADVPQGVTVEYGRYLAGPVAHCMECHTPMGPMGPMIDTDLGRGGFEFHGPWGTSVASNLTSHEDGLAGYSDNEIATMTTEGKRPDGSPMFPPMPYGFFANMTDRDLAAIIVYLRSLPPLPSAG
jgi:mono/diheme cytochrome c family protein